MPGQRTVTVGAKAEKVERLTCETCGVAYDVTLRATGSATGLAEGRDDPELSAKAHRIAEEILARMAPMESCPRCGAYQAPQVERIFHDAAHAALRRRYDDAARAPGSLYARARRLAQRGATAPELESVLGTSLPEAVELYAALEKHPIFAERTSAGGALYASISEGERLARWLLGRRLPRSQAIACLASLYGVDEGGAIAILAKLDEERSKSEGSLTLLVAAVLLLALGGFVALVLGVVIPAVKRALGPKPEPEVLGDWRPAMPVPHVPREEHRLSEPPGSALPPASVRTLAPSGTYVAHDEGSGLGLTLVPDKGTLTLALERGPGTSFGKVLMNGTMVSEGGGMVEGALPSLTLEDVATHHANLVPPGTRRRIGIIAEVYFEDQVGNEARRVLKANFAVHLPAPGENVAAAEVVEVATDEDDAGARLEASLGREKLASIDGALFGDPRSPSRAAGAPALGATDSDIRRAELKERAYLLMEALLESDFDRALSFTAPEDREIERSRLAALRREASIADGKFLEATVDDTGTLGVARLSYTLDREEGSLVRTGACSFRYADGAWLFDPAP